MFGKIYHFCLDFYNNVIENNDLNANQEHRQVMAEFWKRVF
jgi:hypothetical protein